MAEENGWLGDRRARSASAEVRRSVRSLLRGAPFPETPDEGVETEEQDPGREDQLDPWCDAGGEEQDEGDRVAGERERAADEAGTKPDRARPWPARWVGRRPSGCRRR